LGPSRFLTMATKALGGMRFLYERERGNSE
jgi:hypothetical protein